MNQEESEKGREKSEDRKFEAGREEENAAVLIMMTKKEKKIRMWRMEEIMEVNDEHPKIERGVYLAGLDIRLAIYMS
jgi:hypothetical protein